MVAKKRNVTERQGRTVLQGRSSSVNGIAQVKDALVTPPARDSYTIVLLYMSHWIVIANYLNTIDL